MRAAQAYEEEEVAGNDAEFSLGMGSLIGIFFGLALVCGVFFGFGYMMGHRPPGPYVSSEPLYDSPKAAATAVAPKPSAPVTEQPAEAARVVLPTATSGDTTTPSEHAAVGVPPGNVPAAMSAPASPSLRKPQPVGKAAT